jgi:hypothetical protein
MNAILDIFDPQPSQTGDTITMTYCHLNYSGTCTYEKVTLQGGSKKFKQVIYLLTGTDMGDVIEYMYKVGEITGPQDLERVSMLIQTHSRKVVEDYMSRS